MNAQRTLSKYLDKYSEPTAAWARALPRKKYRAAVVVPLFDEEPTCFDRLLAHARGEPYLFVFVFNAPHGVERAAIRRTEACARSLLDRFSATELQREHFSAGPAPLTLIHGDGWGASETDCLLVNALTESYHLLPKEGVGRARKMGCDAALALRVRGDIMDSFLGFSDGDAFLPADYLLELSRIHPENPSCLAFPYRHERSSRLDLDEAMAWVEMGFRHHVLGLARAGSPYAYHSLGSALAVSYQRYAEARGVPNRQAGEDFHLLGKLVKLAPLRRVRCEPVRLLSRVSARVPFGTGPTLSKALTDGYEPALRDPRVFDDLFRFLGIMSDSVAAGRALFREIPTASWLEAEAEPLWTQIEDGLQECPTPAHRSRRLHERFDALATLQFVHRRQRAGRALVPGWRAIEGWSAPPGNVWAALAHLQRLEEELPSEAGLGARVRTQSV